MSPEQKATLKTMHMRSFSELSAIVGTSPGKWNAGAIPDPRPNRLARSPFTQIEDLDSNALGGLPSSGDTGRTASGHFFCSW